MKEAGTCDHRRGYYLDKIERRVLAGLESQLSDSHALELFTKTYCEERKRLAVAESRQRSLKERRLTEIDREIDRGTRALIKGLTPAETIGPVLTSLTAQKRRLGEELAALPTESVIELHPKAIERYREIVQDLAASLSRRVPGDEQVATALRELIDSVIVMPTPGEPDLEIRGRLAVLTGNPLFPQRSLSGVWW